MPVMYAKTLTAAQAELTKIGYTKCREQHVEEGICFRRIDVLQGIDNHVVVVKRKNKIYLEAVDEKM